MDDEPSANGDNGRNAQGRFTEGNPGGPGNPHAGQLAKLRSALLNAVSVEDVESIIQQVLKRAKEGDLRAAKMLLDYSIGRPRPAPELPDGSSGDTTGPRIEVVYIDASKIKGIGRRELVPGLPPPDAFAREDDAGGDDEPGLQTGSISVQDTQYRG